MMDEPNNREFNDEITDWITTQETLHNDRIKLFVILILSFSSSCFFTRMAFMIEKKQRQGYLYKRAEP